MTAAVAVYGGSFDPPHSAHVLVAAHVLSAYDIDELWMIPTWEHPFDKNHGATFEHRLRMCELAMEHLRPVRVLDVERTLGGTSRTLATLTELGRLHPGAALRLVMGADLLKDTGRWHRFDEVARLAPPLVVGRAGHPHPFQATETPFDFPDISSSAIRRRLARGENVDGLLPNRVASYIRDHRLYPSP